MVKKLISGLSALAILLSVLVVPTAKAAWYDQYVDALFSQGVIQANGDAYRPADLVNRGEFAKMVVKAAGISIDTASAPTFSDVKTSDWFYPYVATLAKNSVITGYPDGTFRAGNYVNRAEAAKFIQLAFLLSTNTDGAPHFSDVKASDWYYNRVETVYNYSIVDGYEDGRYGPSDYITRAAVAKMLVKAQNPVLRGSNNNNNNNNNGGNTGSGTVQAGSLDVSLNANTAPAVVIPRGSASIPFTSFDFTASYESDVVVKTLVVTRQGVGAATDFDNVYLYNGSTRLTEGRTINSTTQEVTFTNVNFLVPAGTTRTLMVRADSATTAAAANQHRFALVSKDKVQSTAKSVSGNYPLSGNYMTFSGEQSGKITATYQSVANNSVTIGTADVEVSKFKLGVSSEDAELRAITLTQGGSARTADIENLKLYQGTTLLAETSALQVVNGDDVAVFELKNPFLIAKGDDRMFSVHADIVNGRNADTVKFYLANVGDVQMLGKTFHGNLLLDTAASNYNVVTNTDSQYVKIEGGILTIGFAGPSAQNIAKGSKGVVLANFNFVAGNEDVDVKGVGVQLEGILGSGSTIPTNGQYFENFRFAKDGTTVLGPKDLTIGGSSTSQSIVFTDSYTFSANSTTKLSLLADVKNTIPSSPTATIKATLLSPSTWTKAKALASNTDVKDKVVPQTTITGKIMTVVSAGLTVSSATTPASQNYVKGSQQVELGGFVFEARDAVDVRVTQAKFKPIITLPDGSTLTSTDPRDYISNLGLFVDGVQIGKFENISSDAAHTITFSNLNYTIPSGSSKRVVVKGNISGNDIGNNSYKVNVQLTYASDIVAEDVSNGNSASVSATEPTNAPQMTVRNGGSLVIAADGNTPSAALIVAGAANVDLSKFKASATYESYTITKLVVKDAVVDNADLSEVKITYTNSAGKTESKTASVTGAGEATFNGLDILVPKDSDTSFLISGTTNDTTNGAVSGDNVKVIIKDTTTSGETEKFEAVGVGSGEKVRFDTTWNTSINTVNTMVLHKTLPTVTYIGRETATSGTGVRLLKFKTAADAKGDVKLNKIVAQMFISNGTGTVADVGLYRDTKSEAIHNCTTVTTGSSNNYTVTITCDLNAGTAVNETIAKGTYNNYEIHATINLTAGGSIAVSHSTSIAQDTTNVTDGNFVWSDGTTEGANINGYLVKSFPINPGN